MFSFKVNNVELGNVITITDISRGLAPEITMATRSVQKRNGVLVTSRKYEKRIIKVEFRVTGDVDGKLDIINRVLPYGAPKKIIFGDQPDRYYLAEMNGAGDFAKITRSFARGSFELYCADPLAYATSQKNATSSASKIVIQNNGTAETYPVFNFKASHDYKFFALAHPNGRAIQIGYEGGSDTVLLAGQNVMIRSADCSLFVNGSRRYPNMASKSFGVIPGSTEIVMAVDSGVLPNVTATYREAWL